MIFFKNAQEFENRKLFIDEKMDCSHSAFFLKKKTLFPSKKRSKFRTKKARRMTDVFA